MNHITLHPILDGYLLFAIGGFICLLMLASVFKSIRGMWFRFLGALLILASLFNPQIITKSTTSLKDIALVLVDKSSSQSLEDRQLQIQQALTSLQKETETFKDLEVRYIDILPDGKEDTLGTRALSHLRRALLGLDLERYAGAILITDGQVHDLENFEELPGPLHVLISGEKDDVDRRIEIIDAPQYGLVGETLTIKFRILDNGKPSTKAHVKLIKSDNRFQVIPLDEENIQSVTFIPDHAGLSVLVLESDLLADEINTANNRVAISINGVRDRLRVLLISGQPHQGQRTWRNILRSDGAVDLVHFTILRPSEKEDFTPLNELSLIAFPVRELFEEKLNDFDLIIFDRYYKRNVLNPAYFKNINDYVQKGGGLLISAGPDFAGPLSLAHTELADIMPATPTGRLFQDRAFHLLRSSAGLRHPITAHLEGAEKDWGPWMRLVDVQKNRGETLLEDDQNRPVLMIDRIAKGRIALLLSDHLWLWARGFEGGGPHDSLVRHLAHWLMKEPDLEEEKLSLHTLENNQLEIQRQTLANETTPVHLILPDGSEKDIALTKAESGLWSARMDAPIPGIYRANDASLTALITVGTLNPVEFNDPRASSEILEKVIDKIGGSIHWISDGIPSVRRIPSHGQTHSRNWIGLKQNQAEAVLGIKNTTLFPAWLLFICGLGFWALAWWRESR
jgi:hypothetical protein